MGWQNSRKRSEMRRSKVHILLDEVPAGGGSKK
ncbi:MAG: hypothetical protein IPK88_18010 [Saprospiraceae bacterium]|nr:hypothetical protein [Candidatus Defluviibacterium haderslevense]